MGKDWNCQENVRKTCFNKIIKIIVEINLIMLKISFNYLLIWISGLSKIKGQNIVNIRLNLSQQPCYTC